MLSRALAETPMRFYTFVLKNVVRRRMRSSLTVIGVAVAVGAVVALVGISNSSERSFLEIYRRQNVAIIVQQQGAKQRLTSVLDAKLGKKIAKIPGVTARHSRLGRFHLDRRVGRRRRGLATAGRPIRR